MPTIVHVCNRTGNINKHYPSLKGQLLLKMNCPKYYTTHYNFSGVLINVISLVTMMNDICIFLRFFCKLYMNHMSRESFFMSEAERNVTYAETYHNLYQ